MASFVYYDVVAPGSSNNLIANAATAAGAGPHVTNIPPTSPLDFGNDQANVWKAKCMLVGCTGGTVSQMLFYLFDAIADVAGVLNAENLLTPNAWDFKLRISADYIAPSSFAQGDFLAAPWVSIPTSAGSAYDLSAAIVALNPGNDGTTNLLVNSNNIAGTKFGNAFVYIGIRPNTLALDGDTTNWSFKTDFVSP